MNVETIKITKEEAGEKAAQYGALKPKLKTAEDQYLENVYRGVMKGADVINIVDAFRETGLNEEHQPKLAIAQADWRTVRFHSSQNDGRGRFTDEKNNSWRAYASDISLPSGTFEFPEFNSQSFLSLPAITSAVPHVPASIRPNIHLRNFHILFEVEKWNKVYPVDPFLLRRVHGALFIVIAEWELTPLEASVLSGMRNGN